MNLQQIVSSLEEGARLRLAVSHQLSPIILTAAQTLVDCIKSGGKVLLCGNGGSAADAQHLAAEFVGRFMRDRRPLPAIALTTDSSTLTAIANDFGIEHIFSRQVQALARAGDVLIVISTSGKSPNVLTAVNAAKRLGLMTIGFLGKDGGDLASMVDFPLVIPSPNTARIQECHIAIGHALCELVEETLCANAVEHKQALGPWEMPSTSNKVMGWDILLDRRAAWKSHGKTVVWTNGCFDLVHVGHIRSLNAARHFGDILVVGVNSDSSVRQLKGPTRPVMPECERAELLAALQCVDAVLIFNELTPETALSRLKPEVHCKGADYAPPHGKPVPEAKIVEAYGGKVRFLPLVPDTSTTRILERIVSSATEVLATA